MGQMAPQGQEQMPPMPVEPQMQEMQPVPVSGWRGKWIQMLSVVPSGNQNLFPRWLANYAIVVYVMALLLISILFSSYGMAWYFVLAGIVSMLVFFYYGQKLARDTSVRKIKKEKEFSKRIFWIAFIPRLLITFLLYEIFMSNYGNAFGFECGDAMYYDELGGFVARQIELGKYHFYDDISKWSGSDELSDMGYGIYVGFVYWLTGNSIIVLRLLKCFWSALTVVLLYRLAQREFGERLARITAIFCALWPNFWYYCSAHLKEVEMVFLAVLFVEQADQMLRSRQFTAWKVAPVLLLAAALFTFRTPLALVAILALLFSIVMSSSKVMGWGKRIIVGSLAAGLVLVTMGNRIEEQSRQLFDKVESGTQKGNMEWRAVRKDGNAFAKYAGAAVFAPMIFTLPFPTMVNATGEQYSQQLNHGGNFIKNVLSFFTILSIIALLITGGWREHLLPLSFMLGYILVLVMSTFAHAERFHQPVMPFELMFMVYGISLVVEKKMYKRWFLYWSVLMLIAAIAWSWFKLAGRGMA